MLIPRYMDLKILEEESRKERKGSIFDLLQELHQKASLSDFMRGPR